MRNRTAGAIKSRDEVLKHPKYIECLSEYADQIGINTQPEVPQWATYKAEVHKLLEGVDVENNRAYMRAIVLRQLVKLPQF